MSDDSQANARREMDVESRNAFPAYSMSARRLDISPNIYHQISVPLTFTVSVSQTNPWRKLMYVIGVTWSLMTSTSTLIASPRSRTQQIGIRIIITSRHGATRLVETNAVVGGAQLDQHHFRFVCASTLLISNGWQSLPQSIPTLQYQQYPKKHRRRQCRSSTLFTMARTST